MQEYPCLDKGRGRRPVETLPDHGINIGADVTKL